MRSKREISWGYAIAVIIVLTILSLIVSSFLHYGLNAIFTAYNLPEFSLKVYRCIVFGIVFLPAKMHMYDKDSSF